MAHRDSLVGWHQFVIRARPLGLRAGLDPAGFNKLADELEVEAVLDGVLHTADADFVRFPGLRWFNPITRTGRTGLRQMRAS